MQQSDTTVHAETIGRIRLYGCGGAGINIISTFKGAVGNHEVGHAIAEPVFVDCSRSNIHTDIPDDRILLLDVSEQTREGSGKKRNENNTAFSRNTRSILQKFEPLEFNVVVFSASGGTGSVVGPLIVRELVSRKETVVCIIVGSDESMIAARNTLNTLKSLDNVANQNNAPIVAFYEHNRPELKRSAVDARCREVIGCLSILASRQNAEMDMRDIANWAYYNRVTSALPALAFFNIFRDSKDVPNSAEIISVASLYASPDDPQINISPEYHTAGYPKNKVENFNEAHFAIFLNEASEIRRRLDNRIESLQLEQGSRIQRDRLISTEDSADDNGMVF